MDRPFPTWHRMDMQRFEAIAPFKAYLRAHQNQGLRIGLVPTMGALHEGHLSLVAKAKEAGADVVAASVFVNPKQFGPGEDLDKYPRDLEGDAAKLAEAGCDAIFYPTPKMMYPAGFQSEVLVEKATGVLCGANRPGHFAGVTTVVMKLFGIARPDLAVFGEKDFQQLSVLRIMARDLNLDVEVVGAPLVRDEDGVALSSRNQLLSPKERTEAQAIHRGLRAAKDAYEAGERSADSLLNTAREVMQSAGLEPQYLELRSYQDLTALERADSPAVIFTAVPLGPTRLIDNMILSRA